MSCSSSAAVLEAAPGSVVFLCFSQPGQDEPGWYHTALHALPARAGHQLDSRFFICVTSRMFLTRVWSHLKRRGRQVLSERLNGVCLVVFYETGNHVVAFIVSTDNKLAWFALVYHKMPTTPAAPATGQWKLVKAISKLLALQQVVQAKPRLTYKTVCIRWFYHWAGSGSSPAPFHSVSPQHPCGYITNNFKTQ